MVFVYLVQFVLALHVFHANDNEVTSTSNLGVCAYPGVLELSREACVTLYGTSPAAWLQCRAAVNAQPLVDSAWGLSVQWLAEYNWRNKCYIVTAAVGVLRTRA